MLKISLSLSLSLPPSLPNPCKRKFSSLSSLVSIHTCIHKPLNNKINNGVGGGGGRRDEMEGKENCSLLFSVFTCVHGCSLFVPLPTLTWTCIWFAQEAELKKRLEAKQAERERQKKEEEAAAQANRSISFSIKGRNKEPESVNALKRPLFDYDSSEGEGEPVEFCVWYEKGSCPPVTNTASANRVSNSFLHEQPRELLPCLPHKPQASNRAKNWLIPQSCPLCKEA